MSKALQELKDKIAKAKEGAMEFYTNPDIPPIKKVKAVGEECAFTRIELWIDSYELKLKKESSNE